MADNQDQPTPSTEGNDEHQPHPAAEQTQAGEGGTDNPASETTDRLNICVRDNAQNELHFTVKKTTKLVRVIDAWCARHGISRIGKRFLADGSAIHDDDTPESLELEDGDIIEVFEEQVGGTEGDGIPKKRLEITNADKYGAEMIFRVNPTTDLVKVMIAFGKAKQLVDPNSLPTVSIRDNNTPKTIGTTQF